MLRGGLDRGGEGEGLPIALRALDSGRLGIAAVATGLAQGSLDAAVAYATDLAVRCSPRSMATRSTCPAVTGIM